MRSVRPVRPRASRPPPQPDCGFVPNANEWNFRKADFHVLYSTLASIKWDDIYLSSDVNTAVSVFYEILGKSIDDCVPLKRPGNSKFLYQYPTWYTSELICNVKNKYFHLKRYREQQKLFNLEMFKYYRQKVKVLIDLNYTCYLRETEKNIKINPKEFWKFVKDQQSTRYSTDEFEYDGHTVTGIDAANAFASYFKSVFLLNHPILSADAAEHAATSSMSSSRIAVNSISSHDLSWAVRKLKAHSSAGPDGIPSFLVKDCYDVLKQPLLYIFNLALTTATYPSTWKTSRVTPIHKDGARSKVENYRPIAVLSTFGKVFESILNRLITGQVNTQLTDAQHGFRVGRSTVTNHINFLDYAVAEMDLNKQVDVAYFDFKKAFDRVDNDVLLRKFSAVGFTPNLLKLFASYFSNRIQYVQRSGYRSDPYMTCSGVSQGSTLGPTQFLIMINDLPDVVRSAKCLMFADDLKLFLGIGNSADSEAFQRDIDSVVTWSELNHLEFNISKCKSISFTRRRFPILHHYNMRGVPLERVMQIKDLGLILDKELTFNNHIVDLCGRACKSLGFVMRQAYHFHDRSTILTLYYAFVRSKLEYNSIIWDPHEAKYKQMIEKVQKKFGRYLYSKLFGYYPYLYPSLFVAGMVGINTLELRRKCAVMIHYYLLLNNKVDNPCTLARCSLLTPERARRAHLRRLLAAPPARTHTARYAPTARAVNLLNALIVQDPDIDLFYIRLSTFVNMCVRFLS